jgi:hypothetical protein
MEYIVIALILAIISGTVVYIKTDDLLSATFAGVVLGGFWFIVVPILMAAGLVALLVIGTTELFYKVRDKWDKQVKTKR